MAASAEVLFHREHLPHGDMMVTKQLIIAIDKFRLTNSREQLTLVDSIKMMVDSQLASSACYGS